MLHYYKLDRRVWKFRRLETELGRTRGSSIGQVSDRAGWHKGSRSADLNVRTRRDPGPPRRAAILAWKRLDDARLEGRRRVGSERVR